MGRSVVIGASLSGLFTAVALQQLDGETLIIERDLLSAASALPRSGVPQGRHPHVFLYRGLLAAEQLLPGLGDDLIAAGAIPFNTGDLPWLSEDGWLPTGRPGFEVLSATRPLFEEVVRHRVLTLPGVQLREGARVSELRRDDGRWDVDLADGGSVPADLVVDASGRSSRLSVWLTRLGVTVPEPTEIDAGVGYATRMYQPDREPDDCPGLVLASNPTTLAGGMALRVEQGRWLICALGFGTRRPPRDESEFHDFLATLPDPVLADLAARWRALGDVQLHRQTGNVRRRFERCRDWPARLLAVGDALCAFDPIYGQGITVGACQALLLRDAFTAGFTPAASRRLQRRMAGPVRTPWDIATSEDLRFPTSRGHQTAVQSLLGSWAREVGRLAVHGDRRAADVLGRVYHLVSTPLLLAHPALVVAVARSRLFGPGTPAARPAVLDSLVGYPP
ncbi:hypothetical protein GCM10009841_34420 [Microlunatus panaciterrae]|uniref:2-polyprenyl-6-methoxyphenol hydroxylase-like FAD-dependent oxidoreductase n=1 Tax=Microlunatus panaciterrae TaxID=400768 RepID=A0ABS2RGH5_9ACTN|nr:hypothetical protein [Microlunatus panaciterrae]MBM7798100.1 2-polyprenyl-6-methoxyphenol hydroxylase-like FAD-dependent oxidoreductase [Microlunatus panaciterrae]